MSEPGAGSARSFTRARQLVYGLALASYVLSFFHRTAPAAIAGELTASFAISGAALGTLAATYFYVYTLLQIPVGVAADTLGPRRILCAGAAIAAAGSLLFALAPAWEIAAAGRTLVGIGVAVAFIAILKVSAVWFEPRNFATVTGMTMFAGNLGAVAAGLPLAWVVGFTSWRTVFVVLALMSALLAVASWQWVRDRPEDLGHAPVQPQAAAAADTHWLRALGRVLANPATWPPFLVNVGVGGSFLAFAGLWGVPFLQDTRGLSRVDAAWHTSLLLLGVAVGSLVIGRLSDRLNSRRGLMRACVALYVMTWVPWLLHADWPQWATLAWFGLMGLCIPGFTLNWTLAKEANPPQFAGIATAVVNTGIFLGAGILQPLVGWALDRARSADTAPWDHGIAWMAGAAAFGLLMSMAVSARRQPAMH